MNNEPPVVLVRTWLTLARQSHDVEARDRALEMLKEKIGSPAEIELYMKKHGLN
ncbi:hypothetical protein TUM3794_20480 [Shewanella colwelliana]|uniref:Uncharacterized protein n=1 Tax=Shewanella colwelliana TaxID=23 RepID=A0ABQ4P0P0_SHECO|nr:hypothetical protein [Shewanella colwelliana]GIU41032.1 hypothetical protein TUM3794_20480 [Shewanella colwelliana]